MRIYELVIKENGEAPVYAMSIVENPATEMDFIKLSKDDLTKVKKFQLSDDDKRIIIGPAMVPDSLIERNGSDYGLDDNFFITFSKDTVKQCAHYFLKYGKNNMTTIEHDSDTDKLSLMESWIVEDPEMDKAKSLKLNVPKGTWMMAYKVEDDVIWNDIKSGKINGFSLEGKFAGKFLMSKVKDVYDEILEFLEEV